MGTDKAWRVASGPGFQRIMINSQPVGDISRVKTSYDSIHGKIVSDWERTNGEFHLEVTIPANTTATVFMPVREDSHMAKQSPGVKLLGSEGGRNVYAIESGMYDFRAEY